MLQAHAAGAGLLDGQPQLDAFVGLQADGQAVVHHQAADALEQQVRHATKDHDDLGALLVQPLAGAQIERHAAPAPVGDGGLERDESFGGAFGSPGIVEIRRDGVAVAGAGPVLAAHRECRGIAGVDRLQRAQHLELFVAHRIRVEGGGGLHGDKAQELQQVVLHHVAQSARAVVVGAASADAERLRHRDLDVIDVVGVPQRFEQNVGEAQRQQILHGFLAQIVIDAEDLPLGEYRAELVIDALRRGAVDADRLFHDDARGGRHQRVRGEFCRDHAEQIRCGGQVEAADLLRAAAEKVPEIRPARIALRVDADVVDRGEEGVDFVRLGAGGAGEAEQGVTDGGAVGLAGHRAPRGADDPAVGAELPVAKPVEQGREDLAVGEVARAAENHEVERFDWNDPAGHARLSLMHSWSAASLLCLDVAGMATVVFRRAHLMPLIAFCFHGQRRPRAKHQ